MKKFKLEGKETLSKEQMKKITGGYSCPTGQTAYICTPNHVEYTTLPIPYGYECWVGNGNYECPAAGLGMFYDCGCV